MVTDKNGDFDPRFDPAFQRGFDGEKSAQRAQVPPAQAQSAQMPRSAQRAYETPPARVTMPPLSPPAVVPGPVAASPGTVVVPPLVEPLGSDTPDAAADAAPDRRLNPFLIALAVVSLALLVAGVWGVQAARTPFVQTNIAANTDYVGLQMLMIFAPLSIFLGIATAVGIVFFYAAEWQRRR
jgi:hypothetical protein